MRRTFRRAPGVPGSIRGILIRTCRSCSSSSLSNERVSALSTRAPCAYCVAYRTRLNAVRRSKRICPQLNRPRPIEGGTFGNRKLNGSDKSCGRAGSRGPSDLHRGLDLPERSPLNRYRFCQPLSPNAQSFSDPAARCSGEASPAARIRARRSLRRQSARSGGATGRAASAHPRPSRSKRQRWRRQSVARA